MSCIFFLFFENFAYIILKAVNERITTKITKQEVH
jgi:hypothetical protein